MLEMGLQKIGKKLKCWVYDFGWGWTASRLHSHYEEAVYFLPLIARNSWYSFDWPQKDERWNWPWSYSLILKLGPLDWESSTITTTPLRSPFITPDEVFPELFLIKETALKKLGKVVQVTQVHGSMEAKSILEKFSLLEEKKKVNIFKQNEKKLKGLSDASINAHVKRIVWSIWIKNVHYMYECFESCLWKRYIVGMKMDRNLA